MNVSQRSVDGEAPRKACVMQNGNLKENEFLFLQLLWKLLKSSACVLEVAIHGTVRLQARYLIIASTFNVTFLFICIHIYFLFVFCITNVRI